MSYPWGLSVQWSQEQPGRARVPTSDIGVVVGFQPSLSAQKVVFCHQKDDVFGPVNLPCRPEAGSAGHEAVAKPSLASSSPSLTPEVGSKCQQQPHSLAVGRVRATGYGEHQRLSAGSSRGPQDAVHVGACHHLHAVLTGRPQHYPILRQPKPPLWAYNAHQGFPWPQATPSRC